MVYEFGLKSNIRNTSKDNFQSTLVSSAAAQVNRPHNTSLMSKLSGQKKTAGVICSENVFTWYFTYGRYWILMWNIGYFISNIHKRQNMVLFFIGHSHFLGRSEHFLFWPPLLECLTTANSRTVNAACWPKRDPSKTIFVRSRLQEKMPELVNLRSGLITE